MAIQAGKLRHRITIQRETTTRDEYGSEITAWNDLATVWAQVDPLSPTAMSGIKESVLSGEQVSQDMVRVTLRPRDVTAQDRFVFRDQTYAIRAARIDNTNATMTLFAAVGTVNV